MIFFWSLFVRRQPRRHFALLDENGTCRALHQGDVPPTGGRWVEVTESRLGWIGQPLPAGAWVTPVVSRPAQRRALAA
ncbi:hypothetical protein ACUTAH_17455 [Metapseudomonas furukawaii]|uniref:hypothetical protein n=1 Tax=Metapseudomonas furukawaii TaxID=1149133 RepID=UPI0040459AEC